MRSERKTPAWAPDLATSQALRSRGVLPAFPRSPRPGRRNRGAGRVPRSGNSPPATCPPAVGAAGPCLRPPGGRRWRNNGERMRGADGVRGAPARLGRERCPGARPPPPCRRAQPGPRLERARPAPRPPRALGSPRPRSPQPPLERQEAAAVGGGDADGHLQHRQVLLVLHLVPAALAGRAPPPPAPQTQPLQAPHRSARPAPPPPPRAPRPPPPSPCVRGAPAVAVRGRGPSPPRAPPPPPPWPGAHLAPGAHQSSGARPARGLSFPPTSWGTGARHGPPALCPPRDPRTGFRSERRRFYLHDGRAKASNRQVCFQREWLEILCAYKLHI